MQSTHELIKKSTLPLIMTTLLAACGGSGGDSSTSNTNSNNTSDLNSSNKSSEKNIDDIKAEKPIVEAGTQVITITPSENTVAHKIAYTSSNGSSVSFRVDKTSSGWEGTDNMPDKVAIAENGTISFPSTIVKGGTEVVIVVVRLLEIIPSSTTVAQKVSYTRPDNTAASFEVVKNDKNTWVAKSGSVIPDYVTLNPTTGIMLMPDDEYKVHSTVQVVRTLSLVETDGSFKSTSQNLGTGNTNQADAKNTTKSCPTVSQQEMLKAINDARAEGRKCGAQFYSAAAPLTWSPLLAKVAGDYAADMAEYNFVSHTHKKTGSYIDDRIKDAGFVGGGTEVGVGENLAGGQISVNEVMKAWLDSPGHCAILMEQKYTQVGMSCSSEADSTYGTYWAQEFSTPSAE